MTRHNFARHAVSLTSLAALATTLMPALAKISAGSIAFNAKSGLREGMELYGEPQAHLDHALELLSDARNVVDDHIKLLTNADGPTEFSDFAENFIRLDDALLLEHDTNELVDALESDGFTATYHKLTAIIDEHVGSISKLANMTIGNIDDMQQAAAIGRRAMATYNDLWNFGTVVTQAWLHQNNMGSLIPSAGAAEPKRAKRA